MPKFYSNVLIQGGAPLDMSGGGNVILGSGNVLVLDNGAYVNFSGTGNLNMLGSGNLDLGSSTGFLSLSSYEQIKRSSDDVTLLGSLTSAAVDNLHLVADITGAGSPRCYMHSIAGEGWFIGTSTGFTYNNTTSGVDTWTNSSSNAVLDMADDRTAGGRLLQIRDTNSTAFRKDGVGGSFAATGSYDTSPTNPIGITHTTQNSAGFVVSFSDGEVQNSADGDSSWTIIRNAAGSFSGNRNVFTRNDETVVLLGDDLAQVWSSGTTWSSITGAGAPWSTAFYEAAYNPETNTFLVSGSDGSSKLWLGINGGQGILNWSEVSVPAWALFSSPLTSHHIASVGDGFVLVGAAMTYFSVDDPTEFYLSALTPDALGTGGAITVGSNGRQAIIVSNSQVLLTGSVGLAAARFK